MILSVIYLFAAVVCFRLATLVGDDRSVEPDYLLALLLLAGALVLVVAAAVAL